MPLPTTSTSWPPKQLAQVTPTLDTWSAWWTGDPTALDAVYGRANGASQVRPSQRRGGVVGAVARFWWGRPATDANQHRDQVHVPLPADIARTSADLLFAEPPDIAVKDSATQTRLETELSDALFATLTGAAEVGAALGGVYLRVTWDKAIADSAFITAVPADEAVPEFSWNRLRAVTFWQVVATDGQTWWRHLERHELGSDGNGLVQHGLYQGSPSELGVPVPLADQPATAGLVGAVDDQGYITEPRTRGLNVVHVPNTDPSVAKAWRKIPAAAGLGASDFDGVEPMFDNLDEIHASWMRDLRLAKARLVVARYMLDDNGPGAGASFNMDADVFAPLKMAAAEDGDAPITPVQFKIRFDEHQATAQAWSNRIVRSAGYSVQTFGEHGDVQATATEVHAREDRSLMTRGRKIRAWRPALQEIITKLITIDAAVYGRPASPEGLVVQFPDGVSESPLELAQTALALATAGAASTRSLVALTHPDWDDPAIDAEVALIQGQDGAPVEDPFALR